jgi:hypothetical protein
MEVAVILEWIGRIMVERAEVPGVQADAGVGAGV